MAWSGGTYTKWNGVGGWVTDSLSYGIVPDRHDTQDTDFQNGINNCLTKDGQNTPTANLPMGGFKHTGAGAATANGQYLTYDQVNDASPIKIDFTNDRLGLKISTPRSTLHVAGTLIATAGYATNIGSIQIDEKGLTALTSNGGIEFQGSDTGSGYGSRIVGFDDGALVFASRANSATWTERMRISNAGNVGIGRTPTTNILELGGQATPAMSITSNSGSGVDMNFMSNGTTSARINVTSNHDLRFFTNNTFRVAVTDAGSLTLNTAGTVIGGDFSNATANNKNAIMTTTANDNSFVDIIPNGTATVSGIYCNNNSTRTNSGYVAITSSSTLNSLLSGRNGTGTYLPLISITGGSERWRVNTSGDFIVANTVNNFYTSGVNTAGAMMGANGVVVASVDDNTPLIINRKTSDTTLVDFRRDGVNVGSITVSGGIVAYGSFAGYHWSQFQDGTAPTISVGTIVESINELCEWPDETEKRLPKCKVSDTVASTAVYGVFSNWDTDWTATNDMSIVSVGAYFCRVAAGTVLQIGDLLESAGNGMAQVQADDIVRSKTIGKVIALTQSHIEADGSFCVPTVLYCG